MEQMLLGKKKSRNRQVIKEIKTGDQKTGKKLNNKNHNNIRPKGKKCQQQKPVQSPEMCNQKN